MYLSEKNSRELAYNRFTIIVTDYIADYNYTTFINISR